jgi:cysteine-rich secretory family protein
VSLVACGGDISSGNIDAPAGTKKDAAMPDAPSNATPKMFCVSETNRYRAIVGKPALIESSALETYADTGAMIDFTTSPHNHFTMTQGGGIADAENECPQQGNWMLQPGGDMKALVGQCVAAFYAEGPGGGHYENMMSANTKLGCGIYMMGTGVTIVQDYGP